MKKITLFLAVTAFMFASCSKSEIMPENAPSNGNDIKLNITVSDPNGEDATKAYIKTAWAADDQIKIWYDTNTDANPDLVIKYDGSKWAKDGSATVSGNSPKASGYAKALFNGNVAVAAKDNYTYSESTLTLNIQTWTFLTEIQVVVSGISNGDTLSCDRFSPFTGASVGTDAITATTGAKGAAVNGIANADGYAFVFATSDLYNTAGSYQFTLSSPAGSAAYTANTTITKPSGKIKGLKINGNKFSIPEADAKFNVGSSKVRFASGNLYWNGSAFATYTNQYEYETAWNASRVDKLYWIKNGATVSDAYAEKYKAQATIAAGDKLFAADGGIESGWTVLSSAEWDYLINTRTMTYSKPRFSNLCGGVIIGGNTYRGLFLYPDNYNGSEVSSNVFTWAEINASGIVFLPAAGIRDENNTISIDGGSYLSRDADASMNTYHLLSFSTGKETPVCDGERDHGGSIRLVRIVP